MTNRIAEIRKKQNMEQKELAKILGISVSYLNKVEKGNRNPSLQLLIRIRNVLGTTLDELLFLPNVVQNDKNNEE
jgi:transcriptional regulator with XRE-family HTH domain